MIASHGSLWNVFIYVLLWFISDQHKYLESSCRHSSNILPLILCKQVWAYEFKYQFGSIALRVLNYFTVHVCLNINKNVKGVIRWASYLPTSSCSGVFSGFIVIQEISSHTLLAASKNAIVISFASDFSSKLSERYIFNTLYLWLHFCRYRPIVYLLEKPFWMFFTVSLSNYCLNSFCLQSLQQQFAVIMYSIGNCYIFNRGTITAFLAILK